MPGLVGVVYPDAFQVNHVVDPMLKSLAHRGQEKSTFRHKNAEIGLVGAHFYTNQKKTITLGYDGTVFAIDEIRTRLKLTGCQTPIETVGDCLIGLYETFGTRFLEWIEGDFTLVLFDHEKQKIFLGRDRLGKKPLYWFQNQRYFLFGSELKSLLATRLVPQTPALDALASYLYFGYIPQDMTAIKEVNKLLPAHFIELDLDGAKHIRSFWSFSSYFTNPTSLKKQAIEEQVEKLLLLSIKKTLPGINHSPDVFLQGGLGSSSIAYYLSSLTKSPPTAYTTIYKGRNEEDLKAASAVSQALHIPHKSSKIEESNFLDDFVPLIWHMDEPLADLNMITTWGVAKLAKSGSGILFSGMGSDELFAGHSRYTVSETHLSIWKQAAYKPIPWFRRLAATILQNIYKSGALSLLKNTRENPWQFQYLQENALLPLDELHQASPKLAPFFDPEVFLHKFHHLDAFKSSVSSFLYFDMKTRLADCYMLQLERATAYYNLDWRTPFLDQDLVELLASIVEPDTLKEEETAVLLKDLMRTHLPDPVIDRPKVKRKGLLHPWMISGRCLQAFNMLKKGVLINAGLISPDWLQDRLNDLPQDPESGDHLFALLTLEVWYRLNIDRPLAESTPNITLEELLSEK